MQKCHNVNVNKCKNINEKNVNAKKCQNVNGKNSKFKCKEIRV